MKDVKDVEAALADEAEGLQLIAEALGVDAAELGNWTAADLERHRATLIREAENTRAVAQRTGDELMRLAGDERN